jgi:beta-glucosidase
MIKVLSFPKGFLWGAATSAYQVEGGIENSDWSDLFPAGRCCDHYHLYEQNLDLLEQLNLNAYRFSIEWSRVEPGPGLFDQKEIDHYRQVLRSLRSRGIKTMVTLHHFSNPKWLAEQGGWANPKVVFYFSRFCERVFKEYRELVDFWVTINEPLIYSSIAFVQGRWPPQKRNPILFLKVIKNMVTSHRDVYDLFHKLDPKVRVGIVKNNLFFEPFSSCWLDRLTVRLADHWWNHAFLQRIKHYLDFIGLNYYLHSRLRFPFLKRNENKLKSDMDWEIYPKGIYHVLCDLKRYRVAIYVTENGLADKEDELRALFIRDHLIWIHRAIEQEVDVRGYFHWSLMDNLEWAEGFKFRFGLIEIDYQNLTRTMRKSALFYAKISKKNKLEI